MKRTVRSKEKMTTTENGDGGAAHKRPRTKLGALFPRPTVPISIRSSPPSGDDIRHSLTHFGYAVVRTAANSGEVSKAKALLWNFLEGLGTGIDRNDNTTWDNDRWPGAFNNGIISQYGIGQSPFMWYCRSLPGVKQTFAAVWQTEDLIVSFDGCGVYRPLSVSSKWKTKGGWYHVDQNASTTPLFDCVQGFLNLVRSGDEDGGLVLFPESHTMFCNMTLKHAEKTKRDFVPLPPNEVEEVAAKRYSFRPIKLCLEPGDLVLWDSRTIHCNTPPTSLNTEISTQLRRVVAYICMTPKAKAAPAVLELRRAAVARGISTSHWPHKYQPSKKPRWPRRGLVIADDACKPAELTEEQRKLVA